VTDSPRTVIHVISALALGGAERVMVDLLNGLARRGEAVEACVTRCDTRLASALLPAIPVTVLGRRSTWEPGPLLRFLRRCRRAPRVILHAHGRSSFLFCAVARAALPKRVRLILHDHHGAPPSPGEARTLRRAARHFLDAYVGVSSDLGSWARTQFGAPVHVIGNGIDLTRFVDAQPLPRASLLSNATGLLGVVVGSLRPAKGQLTQLRAAAQSPKAREALYLLLVGEDLGDDYSRECHKAADGLGPGRVAFLGPRADVPSILKSADLGIVPSHVESGPIVLLEYLAAGLPFVATRTGDIAASVDAEGLGLMVPPGDERALAVALDRVVSLSPQARRQMVERGRGFVEQHFGLSQRLDQLSTIYDSLFPASCLRSASAA